VSKRGRCWLALLCLAALPLEATAQAAPALLPPVTGVIWQLYESAPDARGSWHRLGARELLVQWTAVDGIAYVRGIGLRESKRMPDWQRIAGEPWAERVIVGLSGRTDEQATRRSLEQMLEESLRISRLAFPFRVSGWYFPAEIDPTWKDAPTKLPPVLNRLPRPLWISAYDGDNIGAREFADWVASWLPSDVNLLFQDGVGVHVRGAAAAREYVHALVERLGSGRVGLIAEAFRAKSDGGSFRAATAAELRPQLAAYRGLDLPIYLFDGPHYLSDTLVNELLAP
jgi:hypothetical protein